MQFKAFLSFQLFSTFSACEVLFPIVTQHVLLNVVFVEAQLTKLTFLFDISAPRLFALNAMLSKLVLEKEFLTGKSQSAAC